MVLMVKVHSSVQVFGPGHAGVKDRRSSGHFYMTSSFMSVASYTEDDWYNHTGSVKMNLTSRSCRVKFAYLCTHPCLLIVPMSAHFEFAFLIQNNPQGSVYRVSETG